MVPRMGNDTLKPDLPTRLYSGFVAAIEAKIGSLAKSNPILAVLRERLVVTEVHGWRYCSQRYWIGSSPNDVNRSFLQTYSLVEAL